MAAADEFQERADFVADRDLPEADAAGECCNRLFVGRVAPGVHEDHGAGLEAIFERRAQIPFGCGFIKGGENGAGCVHSLVNLDHPLVEGRRPHDLPDE